MAEAAVQGGLRRRLVLEPQCVAAYAMNKFMKLFEQDVPGEPNNSDTLAEPSGKSIDDKDSLVVDAGGGTIDCVKYEMLSAPGAATIPSVHRLLLKAERTRDADEYCPIPGMSLLGLEHYD